MRAPRLPKFLRDLYAHGVTVRQYWDAQKLLCDRGISICYAERRREWVLSAIGGRKPGECISIENWCSLEDMVGYIKDPESAVAYIRSRDAGWQDRTEGAPAA